MFGKLRLSLVIRLTLFVGIAAALAVLSPMLVSAERLGARSSESAPTVSAAGPCSSQTEGQVCAEYFNGAYTSGPAAPVLVRLENLPTRANDWGAGSPGAGVNADHFWARYTANITVNPEVFATSTYQFIAVVDDGVRVYVDGKLIVDGWKDQAATTYRGVVTLGEGVHPVTIEYYENTGNAVAQIGWWEDCRGCFLAEYYNNRTLSGLPVLVRGEDAINYDWGMGSPGRASTPTTSRSAGRGASSLRSHSRRPAATSSRRRPTTACGCSWTARRCSAPGRTRRRRPTGS